MARPRIVGVRTAVVDVIDVLADAVRLLIRHWPVALAWALFGGAWRGATLRAAVAVSDVQGWLGRGLLLLAPLGFLIPLIAILHTFRRDLPNVDLVDSRTAPPDATTRHPRRLLDLATSVLVPFLTVYVSYGFLAQDLDQFVNEAGTDEFYNEAFDFYGTGKHADWSRIVMPGWQLLLLLVGGAFIVRFLLGRAERRWRFLILAVAGALVETYWTSNVAGYIQTGKDDAKTWLSDRAVVHGFQTRYDDLMAALGPFGHPARTVTTWLWDLLGSFDAVVVIPLAWITVAAVVLGHKLAPAPPLRYPVLDRAITRARGVPRPVRLAGGWLGGLFDDIRSRFTGLWNGLRMMARAGLLPMLLFSLAFLLALRVPQLVGLAWRAVVGPVPADTFVAFSPIEEALGQALSLVVLAALLGAAVDRMLLPASAEKSASGSQATPLTPPA